MDNPMAEARHSTDSAVMLVRALAYKPPKSNCLFTSLPDVAGTVINSHGLSEVPERKDYHSCRSEKPSDKGMLDAAHWAFSGWDLLVFFRQIIAHDYDELSEN